MTDRYDDELKLVLEDLADLMQNEASPKKSKILQLLMNNKSDRNQIFTLLLMKDIKILVLTSILICFIRRRVHI